MRETDSWNRSLTEAGCPPEVLFHLGRMTELDPGLGNVLRLQALDYYHRQQFLARRKGQEKRAA